ncbi:MAG: hypothetical protein GXP27_16520, partial [Planctomycetes bacterium]|nr:hypothetical protein [Planctomycetota bacterium]
SIIADPKFRDPLHRDFRLPPDSPAISIGFRPFDSTEAGVYGDPGWIRKAKEVKYPPVELPPPPPSR